MQNIIETIGAGCHIRVSGYEQVSGGDINDAYCIHENNNTYFLKLNDAQRFPSMFTMEAAGLEALRNNTTIKVPGIIAQGITHNKQWLLLQWIEKGIAKKNTMEKMGTALAAMHQRAQPHFGWHSNNYIGSLVQINTPHSHWHSFFTQCRIMPLVKMLFDTGIFSKADITAVEAFCKYAETVFPEEPPCLLHGDLWGGNYMIDTNGDAVIFDPAVYYGHREMDLGMTKLFGGFNESFYAAYQDRYPAGKGWQQRLHVTQLYPLLVHAVLFGGHYTLRVKEIIRTAS